MRAKRVRIGGRVTLSSLESIVLILPRQDANSVEDLLQSSCRNRLSCVEDILHNSTFHYRKDTNGNATICIADKLNGAVR